MNLRTMFTINAIVAVLIGLALLLIPGSYTELYDVQLDDAGLFMARLLGSVFLMTAIVAWQSRFAEDSLARQAIVQGYFAGFALSFVVSLVGQLNGIANALGWTTVAINLLFALAYAYFQFRNPAAR